jgi:hypothetical protein
MTENVIHIKLEKNEAIAAKRDILHAEGDLIKVIRTMKAYQALRSKELTLKLKLLKKVNSAKRDLGKIKRTLPKFIVPEILQREEPEEPPRKIEPIKPIQYDDDLESQLQEIQDKLSRLK